MMGESNLLGIWWRGAWWVIIPTTDREPLYGMGLCLN